MQKTKRIYVNKSYRGRILKELNMEDKWEEEEQFVVVELPETINKEVLTNSQGTCQVLDIHSENPVMQVGQHVFAGEYDEEGVSPGVQLAFASMLGGTPGLKSSGEEDSLSYDDDEDDEDYNVAGEKVESKKRKRRGKKPVCRKKRKQEEEEDSLSYVDDEDDEDYNVAGEKVELKKRKRRGKKPVCRKKRKQEEEEDSLSYVDDEDDEDYNVAGEKVESKKRKRQGRKQEEEDDALEMELNREKKKKKKKAKRQHSKLDQALRGLMGEANLRFARGEKQDAILMCKEIIRQAPLAYEPFFTLAMIYDDGGDTDKALQYGLIAAHLNPSDCEEWIRLANMSLGQDNIRQAIACYTKAIKYDPTNVRYLWERSSLYMRLGDNKQCMDGYCRILQLLPLEDGELFMQLSKDMVKSYYESNNVASALSVINEALVRHPDLVGDDFINMAAELYITSHKYHKALQVLAQFAGIVLVRSESKSDFTAPTQEQKELEETVEEGGTITDVQVPDTVPVDLMAKLIVCLIHLRVCTPVESLVTSLMGLSPEEVGDLYLDVAEAYLDQGQYMAALPLLAALVSSEKYNLAEVWLRHAECLKALGHMEAAADSYTKVVEMAPQHLEARLSLATLLQQLGRPKCALKALESMYDSDTLAQDSSAAQKELKRLLHRSTLLKSQGQIQEHLDAMITMVSMLLKVAMEHAKVCVRVVKVSGQKHLRLVRINDVTPEIADHVAAYLDNTGKTNVLSKEDWWQLLVSTILTLCDVRRYEEAGLLVDSALEFYSFYDNKPRRKELEFLGLSATILDHNQHTAYNYIRRMVMENVNVPQLWNIFNQLTMSSSHQRHHRFCLRLLQKHPDNHALSVLCGHNAMASGSFKFALAHYVQAFHRYPNNPLYSLCVGVAMFNMAAQRDAARRHTLVLQGFVFLWRYVELRGVCQETMYNLGRALHQMGLCHLAIHYYQKALELPAETLEGIADDQVDLRREIAFNLSQIHQSSGNMELARHVINTHCVV